MTNTSKENHLSDKTTDTAVDQENAWMVDFDENVEKATDMIYQAAMLYEQLEFISGHFDDALEDLSEEDLNGPVGDALARPQHASHRALDLLVAAREMWGLESDDPRYVEITKRASEDFVAQMDDDAARRMDEGHRKAVPGSGD